jgi:hypothetical protein
MIKSDLVAERIAIDTYRNNIIELGNEDSTTRRLFEHILAQEEEQAHEFAGLLENLGGKEKSTDKKRSKGKNRDVESSDAARGGAEGRRHQTARGEGPAVKSNLHQVVEVANELVPDEIHEGGSDYIAKE